MINHRVEKFSYDSADGQITAHVTLRNDEIVLITVKDEAGEIHEFKNTHGLALYSPYLITVIMEDLFAAVKEYEDD